MTPKERALRGRIGALTLHASGRTTTNAARAAFTAKFYDGVPNDLPQGERDRRADFARRAYFTRLAYRSARARASRAGRQSGLKQ